MNLDRLAAHLRTDDRIFDEAACWLSKSRAGLSANDQAALLDWLKAAPEHAAAMELVTAAWADSGEIARSTAMGPELLRAKNLGLADFSRHRSQHRMAWGHRLVGAVLAAIVCLGLAVAGWFAASSDAIYRTGRGEIHSIELQDGSQLTLGSGSVVQVQINPLHRDARLVSGEVEFEIAHEEFRPFTVRVREIVVRDLGTRFTVRDRTGPVRVVLISGKAQVAAQNSSFRTVVLAPGQQAIVQPDSIQIGNTDLLSALAWRDNRIVFRDVILADALERWREVAPVDFDVRDPALLQVRISGTYRTTDVVAFLNGLSRVRSVAWQETAASHFSLRSARRTISP